MLLLLKFDSKTVKKPIISKATIETGALINILRANVGARRGEMVVEVEDDKAVEVEDVFGRYGVDVSELRDAVVKDEDRCVHCGLCISICPVEVFRYDENWKVVADTSKCIHCGVCVNVCPCKALSLPI
jgi:ferredoxin